MATCPVFRSKIQHETREDALEHQKMLVFHDAATGQSHKSKGLSVYRCQHCRKWHVGHDEDGPPLVWHYTTCRRLDAILDSGALIPPPPRALIPQEDLCEKFGLDEATVHLSKSFVKRYQHGLPAFVDVPVPNTTEHIRVPCICIELQRFLWFSRNANWEHSIDAPSRIELEVLGQGLLRFGVLPSVAKLRWSDYLERNHTPPLVRDVRTVRGDPTEWLGTDQPVPLDVVKKVQVYFRSWMPLEDVDGDAFEQYLKSRGTVYAEAAETLDKKFDAVPDELLPRGYLPPEKRSRARAHDDLKEYCSSLARHIDMTEAERIVLEELWYGGEDRINVRSKQWRPSRRGRPS